MAILFSHDVEVLRGWVVMSEMNRVFIFLDSRTRAEDSWVHATWTGNATALTPLGLSQIITPSGQSLTLCI